MTPPKVFISYSHDSEVHKDWVRTFATDLRNGGIDAILDQWRLKPGQDIAAFMQHGIIDSDRVLLVCSEEYVRKAEGGAGGVGYERLIVTAELVANIDTRKFIPLLRNNPSERLPVFLGPRLFIDFSKDDLYTSRLDQVLRELLGAPSSVEPPIGPNPFSGASPPKHLPRSVGPTGLAPSGAPVLEDQWFSSHSETALKGISKVGLTGQMELRFALHDAIAKSQVELLNAVRRSEIRTFGWPIGVILDNREEYRPRPLADGIRAEIAISEGTLTGRKSYDYWALRSNGDFYLLQSLFEDQRTENAVFFNTRIVRVTEAILFAANLYENLGVAPETKVSLRVTHRGLTGRVLASSNLNRDVRPGKSLSDVSQTQLVESVGLIRQTLIQNVRRVTEPMFILFDFKEFGADVYTDIVNRFVAGEVT